MNVIVYCVHKNYRIYALKRALLLLLDDRQSFIRYTANQAVWDLNTVYVLDMGWCAICSHSFGIHGDYFSSISPLRVISFFLISWGSQSPFLSLGTTISTGQALVLRVFLLYPFHCRPLMCGIHAALGSNYANFLFATVFRVFVAIIIFAVTQLVIKFRLKSVFENFSNHLLEKRLQVVRIVNLKQRKNSLSLSFLSCFAAITSRLSLHFDIIFLRNGIFIIHHSEGLHKV